jgi:hypothetical protein
MLIACVGTLLPDVAAAHGLVGKRFFPATLTTEDPFVADELSLPTLSGRKMPASSDEPPARETAFSADVTKRVTENFGIGFGASYLKVQPEGGATERGFDNLELGLKYQLYQDADRESILSVGVDWDIGGSGSKRVGAEPFSTITPALFFGKGFGDLPPEARYLRPLALTGQLGVGLPTRSRTTTGSDGDVVVERNPHVLQWGFALEYSFPYLQSYVQDVGLAAPFNRMIPVVEFAMSTALDRGASGTTGTINPGIIWAGTYFQLAAEAQIPVNKASGRHTGWIVQLHFYLDDLFPNSLGRPIFRQ